MVRSWAAPSGAASTILRVAAPHQSDILAELRVAMLVPQIVVDGDAVFAEWRGEQRITTLARLAVAFLREAHVEVPFVVHEEGL